MMKEFDLNLLRVVVALYDAGSVGRAAQSLGMSQPALSAALARLRQAFGEPLFVRTARGMSPTPRAHALAAGAREVLARVADEVLSEATFEPATTTARFTFALSDVGEMVFLPKILESLQRLAPQARVRSLSLPPARLEQALESGEVDLAVGYYPDIRSSAFFQQRLFTHRFSCLLRADHPIRGRKLTLDKFLALGHAVVRAEGRSQEIFEKYLERKKIARRIVLLTPHFMSIPTIIGKTDLVPNPDRFRRRADRRPAGGCGLRGRRCRSPAHRRSRRSAARRGRSARPAGWTRRSAQLGDDVEDLAHDQRGQAQARLVEHQQLGLGHQGAAHRQHLPLAAGQRAGQAGAALLEAREGGEDLLHGLALVAVAVRDSAGRRPAAGCPRRSSRRTARASPAPGSCPWPPDARPRWRAALALELDLALRGQQAHDGDSMVVLPAPLGPITVTISPRLTLRLMWCSASTLP
jgi:DNA-binding transcriptional LysR family regulator